MQAWYFSEMSYHPAWKATEGSLRNEFPNRHFDPVVGADLYNRFLDEYALCDELGLNLMVNEHHSTATCLDAVCNVPLAILARITKKARLLALGMPIANRADPVRVAEEFAMIDVISRGRVEMGLVKGSPQEVFPANSNPVLMMDRFWEAHDLILKAMTTHDGPFSWEGTYFHHRSVNIWPRPYQQPHPPVWITASSPVTAKTVAQKGYVLATLASGFSSTRPVFDAYRSAAVEAGRPAADDRLAYLALVGVGKTKEEGFRRADQVLEYLRNSGRTAKQYLNPPGYSSTQLNVTAMRSRRGGPVASHQLMLSRDGRPLDRSALTVENMIDAGIVMAGTPDMVFQQISDFYHHVGGLGHLLIQAQGAYLSHQDTVENVTLFAKEVLPRLRELRLADVAPPGRSDLVQARVR